MSLKDKYNALVDWLNARSKEYYVDDRPTVTDSEWDSQYHALKAMELTLPKSLVREDSPTRTVGVGKVGVGAVAHTSPMLSLDNTFSVAEAIEWCKGTTAGLIYAEWKYDGLAISLRYSDGVLYQALTRGDGTEGEDVTSAVNASGAVPLTVSETGYVEVRGELTLPKAAFIALNERLVNAGEPEYVSVRNAAAGLIRRLDVERVRTAGLKFYAYDLTVVEGVVVELDYDVKVKWLVKLGFNTTKIAAVRAPEYAELDVLYTDRLLHREAFETDVDGLVLKVNDYALQQSLGIATRIPRYAVALKFPAVTVLTTLKDCIWQIGRTGNITPVGVLEPVVIGGVTVDRCSLYGVDEIERLGLGIGSRVHLARRGDVIPKIVAVETPGTPITVPDSCPCCKSQLDVVGAYLKCTSALCPERHIQSLAYFVGKSGLDIKDLGESTVRLLVDAAMVRSPSDFFILTETSLVDVLGPVIGPKLFTVIGKRAECTAVELLTALGIPSIGEVTVKRVLAKYPRFEQWVSVTVPELAELRDISEKTAECWVRYFAVLDNRAEVERLVNLLTLSYPDPVGTALAGHTYVITGTFPIGRDIIRNALEQLGAKVVGTVSKKTTGVFAGDNAGSKLDNALKLSIPVLSYTDYLKLIGA